MVPRRLNQCEGWLEALLLFLNSLHPYLDTNKTGLQCGGLPG